MNKQYITEICNKFTLDQLKSSLINSLPAYKALCMNDRLPSSDIGMAWMLVHDHFSMVTSIGINGKEGFTSFGYLEHEEIWIKYEKFIINGIGKVKNMKVIDEMFVKMFSAEKDRQKFYEQMEENGATVIRI